MPFISGSGGGGGAISGVTVTGTAASGDVPVATSASAGSWVFPPGHEFGYAQITSPANVTDTAEATATALISPGAITFDGGAVFVEFFCVQFVTDSAAAGDLVTVTVFEGATQIVRLCESRTLVTSSPNVSSISGRFRFTPTVGAHTYKLCAFASSVTGTPQLNAGAGGTGGLAPCFIRFVKA